MKCIYDAEGTKTGTVKSNHGCLSVLGWFLLIALVPGIIWGDITGKAGFMGYVFLVVMAAGIFGGIYVKIHKK